MLTAIPGPMQARAASRHNRLPLNPQTCGRGYAETPL